MPDLEEREYIEIRKPNLKDIKCQQNHISNLREKAKVCGKRVGERVRKRFKKCKVYHQNEHVFVILPNGQGRKATKRTLVYDRDEDGNCQLFVRW